MYKIDNKLIDIGVDEIKTDLAQYASEHWWLRKKPIDQINILNIDVKNAYEYVLVSFTETRQTMKKLKPYSGTNNCISEYKPMVLYTEGYKENKRAHKID